MTNVRRASRRPQPPQRPTPPRSQQAEVAAARQEPAVPWHRRPEPTGAPVLDQLRMLDDLEASHRDLLAKCKRYLDKNPALADEVARYQAERSNIALQIAAGAHLGSVDHTSLSQTAKEFVDHRALCENSLLECANLREMIARMDAKSLEPIVAEHLEHRQAIAQIRQQNPDAVREVLAFAFASMRQTSAEPGQAIHLPVLSQQAQELRDRMEIAKEVSRHCARIQIYLWHKEDGPHTATPAEVKGD